MGLFKKLFGISDNKNNQLQTDRETETLQEKIKTLEKKLAVSIQKEKNLIITKKKEHSQLKSKIKILEENLDKGIKEQLAKHLAIYKKKEKEKGELQLRIKTLEKKLISYQHKESENNQLKSKIKILEEKLKANAKDVGKNTLVIYEDKEKKALELEITQLEEELQNLSEAKNEYINDINAFNTQYTLELGELIETLLELKKELLQLQIDNNNDVEETIYKEYEEIKEEYENFHNDYEETIKTEQNKRVIGDEELKELKAIFRKAVKICHPDIVEDKHKEEAHSIMLKLNDAYQRKMLDEVLAIFESLETNFNSHEILSDIAHLKQKIPSLQKAINDIKLEIEEMISSEEYILLSEIENFDLYFNDLKEVLEEEIQKVQEELSLFETLEEELEYELFKMEESNYSRKLRTISYPNFNKIRKQSIRYINNLPNSDKIFHNLGRGTKILNEKEELYQYIVSYGKMHKTKLYASFDTVIHQLNNKTINVIDWGCGQALATSLLIDYLKENSLNIDISNVILIEPSSLALSRGMLHIDVLKEDEIDIKAVNKDIDSLEISDLTINNSNITLHLFSNILDVEFFRLDINFLEKIASSQKGLNYFVCVSPNINDKRNARLDMFYRYFNEYFEMELISSRDTPLNDYTRYEKIFKVANL